MRYAVIGLFAGLLAITASGSRPAKADPTLNGDKSSPYREVIRNGGQGAYLAVRTKFFQYGLYKPPYFKRYHYDGDYFLYPVEIPTGDPSGLVPAGSRRLPGGFGRN